MTSIKQLRLLLHHKLLLHRRQPTTLVLEIFWPVLVFLSVFFVKLQFPVTHHQTCHYNSRALPSAGVISAVQSLICTLDNPCVNESSFQEVATFPDARIHNLMTHLIPLANEPNVSNFLLELPKGMALTSSVLNTLAQPDINTILETGIPLNDLFKEIDFRRVAIDDETSLGTGRMRRGDVPQVVESFKHAAKAALPHLRKLMTNFSLILDLEQEFKALDVQGSAFDLLASPQMDDIISKVMCGEKIPPLTKKLQLLKEGKGTKKPQVNNLELQAISNPFCREGYQFIMNVEGGPMIWSFLKPLFSGKILYTPDNQLTRSIISRMNHSVEVLSKIKGTFNSTIETMISVEKFYRSAERETRLQAVRVLIDFLNQHLEGILDGLSAERVVDKIDNSKGLLSLLKFLTHITQCIELERFIPFRNEAELEEAAKGYAQSHELIAAVVFLNLNDERQPLPHQVEYKLRTDIGIVPSTKMLKERMWEPGAKAEWKDLGYQRGFVQVQETLDRAIILTHLNMSHLIIDPEVYLQQFPYLCYDEDKFALYMRALTPVVATMAWIFFIAYLIRDRVLERELHLEEMLKVLGLKPTVAWITWFLLGFLALLISSFIGLLILTAANMFPHSNFWLLYAYVMCFCWSLIMYCYLMSAFFERATIASLSGIVAYLASYLPFMVAITLEYEMTFLHKIATCLSMSTSFCFGMMYLSRFESQGSGIHWTNIWHSPMADDPMSFGWAGVMMIVDGLIYFIIGWYVSNVWPAGSKASAQPFYFFLTPHYWNISRRKSNEDDMQFSEVRNKDKFIFDDIVIDSSWNQRRPGMSLQDLRVVYNNGSSNQRVAVRGLTLELKEGQVSTILGRNGAGKTTTINVLTGQLKPTSGCVSIYGYEIPRDFRLARKLVGYCPQYNTLFGDLTVREHLLFYCRLKGLIPEEECGSEVEDMLDSTKLRQVENEQAKCLSGGLQRRLCVALAFVGGSKLVILDEPTSSVDPVARRGIWDLITDQKQSRTVLLTTHHLDEADILSDQVAILHRGRLLCTGSPLLLRSRFGCGYQLTVSKSGSGSDVEAGDSDSGRASNESPEDSDMQKVLPPMMTTSSSEKLLSFVKCLIPNASLLDDFGNEVVLSLPYQSLHGEPHDYAVFFRCLDANIKSLGFTDYGLTSTTLEDVFVSLCNQEEQTFSDDKLSSTSPDKRHRITTSGDKETAVLEIKKQFDEAFNTFDWSAPSLKSGVTLKLKQLKGILLKRVLHARHDIRSVFCNLLLPCLFMALAMGMTLIKPKFAPDPILPLSPRIYGQGVISFIADRNPNLHQLFQELSTSHEREYWCPRPRKGWDVAKCPVVKGVKHSDDILLPPFLRTFSGKEWDGLEGTCHCEEQCYSKSSIAEYSQRVSEPTKSGLGFVYNTSDIDVSQFLLNTFTMFNDKRYGGFSSHQRMNSVEVPCNVVKVWFDNNGFHSMSSYLNALSEGLLRANILASGKNASDFSIRAHSHPLHVRSGQVGDQTLMQRGGDAGIALIILVGIIFVPTSFSFYVVSERIREETQLQKTFGVGPILYWTASLMWDIATLIVAVFLSGIVIIVFQMPIYTARENFPAVLLLIFLFGWSMTGLVYLLSRFFKEPSIAFMVLYSLALFIGINTMVVRLLIDVFELVNVSPTFKLLFEQICQFLPPYTLMSGLVDITRNQLFTEMYVLFDHDVYVSPFSMKLLGQHFITLGIEGFVFFFLHVALECFKSWQVAWTTVPTNVLVANEDSDVAEERLRVTNESSRFDIMRVMSVTKKVKGLFGTKAAVDGVSFAIGRGECFGLLGVNGAGKTTLFRILTGQIRPTTGKTIINRMSISRLLSNSSQVIGYCPQADALDEVLSPRQHLTVYAELRGVPSIHISRVVADSLSRFQLVNHADVSAKALSRGTRRKLCLAIAMLGSPQIVLLDEPTSGMDPMSRRCLWNNIQDALKDRRSVLLTTHTMEECDLLCSRLAIMVNGRFRCIGSPQYLKNKFGAGYVVTLRLSDGLSNWNEAIFFMQHNFPCCVLRAHHHNLLEFSLASNDMPLSTIFAHLRDAKELLQLQDFFVSQTTLDQVFINFAREQNETSEQVISLNKKSEKQPTRANIQRTKSSVYSNVAFVSSTTGLNAQLEPNRKVFARNTLQAPPMEYTSPIPRMKTINEPSHSRNNTRKRTDFDERLHHVCPPQHHYAKTNGHVQLLPHSRIRTTRF